eukprot:GEMP01043378.1.p1 GENE.GEMP01043378.1~~GEMP01043378.1.p1  ORF type:complete len:248 (+),score=57.34 GEMP01043378.1:89-832(+)
MTGYSAPAAHASHQHHARGPLNVRSRILLADGSALFGDCGEAGASDAACSSRSAAVAASHATPVRKYAYRDAVLKSADARIPHGNCAPVSGAPRVSSQYHATVNRVPATAGPAASRQGAQVAGNRTQCTVQAPRALNQYQQYAMECQTGPNEVRPIPGVGIPRSSIGAGHPRGPIAQVVQKPLARGAEADLSPLLPCTYPPNQHVTNPSDGDLYHRTSVYAASGLPIDMPAYTGPRTWTERMHHARP